jgi:hypothetical protein
LRRPEPVLLNRDGMSEMMRLFDQFWEDRLKSLKEYVENKTRKKRK